MFVSRRTALGFVTASLVWPPISISKEVGVNRRASKLVNVFDYMTPRQIAEVQQGTSANDTAAVMSACEANSTREIFFPAGTYAVDNLVQPEGQQWHGEGGQRATTFRKRTDGDLITMQSRGGLSDINLDCHGETFDGRGVVVASGFSQKLNHVRVAAAHGNSLYFAANAGGGANISAFEGTTSEPLAVAAIKLADDATPTPRFFSKVWLAGGIFDFAGAGNGSSLSDFFIGNFVTSPASRLMHIVNGRVASGTDKTTISGADCEYLNVAFSGPVVLNQAQGIKLANCSFGSGISENSENCQYNYFTDQAKLFRPTWTQRSGAQPVLGNGRLLGYYLRAGYACIVSLRLEIGSMVRGGNAGAPYQISLPYRGHPAFVQRGIPVVLFDASRAATMVVYGSIGANEQHLTMGLNGSSVRSGYPFQFAVGDSLDAQFTYAVR